MATNRLTSRKIKTFLESVQPVPVHTGPRIVEAPDRLIMVTIQNPAGLTHETLFEDRLFQVRIRGAQNNYDDAEELAFSIDDIFLNLELPWEPVDPDGGKAYVTSLTWSGGGPSPLSVEEASYRYSFTCNYVARAATGVGD